VARRKLVLVVDDEPDILHLVKWALERARYRVETAANGREALDMIGRRLPDLIVLDMKMPVMDGWEFAKEFRAAYDSSVPIVVLTAAADAKKRAEEIGAAGWIGKPFDLDALVNTVDRLTGK